MSKVGIRTLAGALVVTGPAVAACSTGPTFDQWAATDGAAGRINLDDVQDAFKKATSPTAFEVRVNEIYEGDSLVLIRVKQEGSAKVVEGWEDLNSNYDINDTQDDLLFTIRGEGEQNDMRGYGANSYYHRPFGGGGFLLGYMLASSFGPRGHYQTSNTFARGTLRQRRSGYRNTSRYKTQVSRNGSYFSKRGGFSASQYNNSGRNLSTARRTYRSNQQKTGMFKNSRTGVRSSWGSSSRGGGFGRGSRGGRFGGGRGFGGGQVIIGNSRW